jgi:fatty acid amide hydrolase
MTVTRVAPDSAAASATAAGIARRIAQREVTALQVVEEHIRRIEDTHSLLNAVVVPMFDSARAAAREADAMQARGEPLPPLHGVPVTIKECFDIEGTPTTIGLARRRDHRSQTTAPLVTRLTGAGAIVLGKTNVPELLVYYESDNPCYGRTNNPWSLDRSPGGSSGGEGAIVAAGASPLGLGSDIGGSVRVPAHFCGVHGLKPTSHRLSMRGVFGDELFPGQEAIADQPGPLARSVEDLTLAMSVLASPGQEQFDEEIPPVPWDDGSGIQAGSLRVGMYVDDGVVTPGPAIRRAVHDAADMLRAAGARVRDFQPPYVPDALMQYFRLLGADGASWARVLLGAGPHDRRITDLVRLSRLRPVPRAMLVASLRAAGQRRLAELVSRLRRLDTAEYWALVAQRTRYRRAFLEAMDRAGIDAIICPPVPYPALRHGASYHLTSLGSYAMLYNLLGTPAGVVSITRARPGEETDRPPSRDLVERTLRRTEEGSAGLPLGVQVVARHWREDIVLAVMRELEAAARERPDYPLRELPILPGIA